MVIGHRMYIIWGELWSIEERAISKIQSFNVAISSASLKTSLLEVDRLYLEFC